MDKQKPLFQKGGKLENLYYLFEAGETFLFSPNHTTGIKGAQVKDAIDLKRILKLAINMMVGLTAAMVGEALTFGEAGGMDWEQMIDIIGARQFEGQCC